MTNVNNNVTVNVALATMNIARKAIVNDILKIGANLGIPKEVLLDMDINILQDVLDNYVSVHPETAMLIGRKIRRENSDKTMRTITELFIPTRSSKTVTIHPALVTANYPTVTVNPTPVTDNNSTETVNPVNVTVNPEQPTVVGGVAAVTGVAAETASATTEAENTSATGEAASTSNENKEDTTMNTTKNITVVRFDAEEILARLDVQKTSDPDYLRKDWIVGFLNTNFGREYTKTSIRKIKRDVLAEELRNELNKFLGAAPQTPATADSIPADGEAAPATTEAVNAKRTVRDLADEYIQVYTSEAEIRKFINGTKRGKKYVNGFKHYAQKNRNQDMISDYIFISVVAEHITGKPLKRNGKPSTYSEAEKYVIQGVLDVLKEVLIKRTERDENGRAKVHFFNAHTVYEMYKDAGIKYFFEFSEEKAKEYGKKGVCYIIRNGKLYLGKKVQRDKITSDVFTTLDTSCTFYQVC